MGYHSSWVWFVWVLAQCWNCYDGNANYSVLITEECHDIITYISESSVTWKCLICDKDSPFSAVERTNVSFINNSLKRIDQTGPGGWADPCGRLNRSTCKAPLVHISIVRGRSQFHMELGKVLKQLSSIAGETSLSGIQYYVTRVQNSSLNRLQSLFSAAATHPISPPHKLFWLFYWIPKFRW